MASVDWSQLGRTQQGLAVEGKDDKRVIEAFLDAGENTGHWKNWRGQLRVEETGGGSQVLRELDMKNARIWGLIDRDRLRDNDIAKLQSDYPKLLILPRFTIENYLVAPNELPLLLPPKQLERVPHLADEITTHTPDWVRNGALWYALSEHGAHDFCRGATGYPKALLSQPVSDKDITIQLEHWHTHLDPNTILNSYHQRINDFQKQPDAHYTRHIHGKNFFKQVITPYLNKGLGQKSESEWFEVLANGITSCPADIAPLLKHIIH